MLDEYEKSYTYDYPIEIGGLNLYPVTMRQYIEFFDNIGCLLINKNRIPDAQVISMSYLAFLYYISLQKDFLKDLENLLYICFRLDKEKNTIDFNADEKGKPCIIIYEKDTNNKWQFSHKDFNKIRQIICGQNLVEMPDEKIDPKLEAVLLEAQVLKNKLEGNLKVISIEDQMVSVAISSSFTFESIYSLPIRKFVKILERKNKELHYLIYKTAEMGGMVEFKEKIVHYLYDNGKGKYDEFFTDYDEYKGKVGQVADINKGG
jgi:hypothetical protein